MTRVRFPLPAPPPKSDNFLALVSTFKGSVFRAGNHLAITLRSNLEGRRARASELWKPVSAVSVRSWPMLLKKFARKKLVGQRVTLENQIRGLAVVFGVRLPRGLSPAFVDQVIAMSDGVAGLSGAMRGLVAARDAVLGAIAAIDGDMKKMVRASDACRRLMTIPASVSSPRSPSPQPSTIRAASVARATLVPILAWSRDATSPARSTMSVASPRSVTGGCEPCSTRRPTS